MPKKLFAKGNTKARGGERKNAGRKPAVVRELLKDWKRDTDTIHEVLTELKRLALEGDSHSVRVSAAHELLDRMIGKARQNVDISMGSKELAPLYSHRIKAEALYNLLDPKTRD